ncbi:MAG: PepSY domain-containing protein [Bacteroidia bacterium]|nr:PepSY domain-containing protein [Bacteroidia bacterium]
MKKWKWIHRWFSVVFGLVLLMWAASGIVLNHRNIVSGIDVPRQWLPANYTPDNWNLATVRSALRDEDGWLAWGNIGIWRCDSAFGNWRSFMYGIPEGMDNRRTMRVIQLSNGAFYAATQSGLYKSNRGEGWTKIALPLHDERIMDLSEAEGKLYVVSRSEVFVSSIEDEETKFEQITLPPAHGDDGKISLFRTLWVLHSGEVLGLAGKLVVDLLGLLLIFFVVTGYIYFFFPKLIRRRKRGGRNAEALAKTNRFSIKWHNKLGLWLGGFLVFTALTGMFLRPPLLIAIAQSRVPKLKGTLLNHPNTWHDRLRAVRYSKEGDYFLIVTNDGLYYTNNLVAEPARPFHPQPPLSVMGVNVLEQTKTGAWLIGSFNGLFMWNPPAGSITDYITGESFTSRSNVSSPISNNMVAGFIPDGEVPLIFDYNRGLINQDLPMPELIARQPFPLWNLALEMHTGRIFQQWIGPFYILLVPVIGVVALLILMSGLVIFLRRILIKKHSK